MPSLSTPARIVSATVVLALIAAACGDESATDATASDTAEASTVADSAPDEPTGGTSTTPPATAELGGESTTPGASSDSAEVRTVDHAAGTTDVPASPQRVVALDESAAFVLLDLGIEPVQVLGSFFTTGTEPVLDEYGIEIVPHDITNPSLEAVAALQPDLLVGADHPASIEAYDSWSGVAPTVLFSNDEPWQNQVELVARAVGADDLGNERIAQLESEIDRVVGRLDAELDQAPTVSIVGQLSGMPFALARDGNAAGQFLDDLGLGRPRAQDVGTDEAPSGILFLSPEVIGDQDADTIVVLSGSIYESDPLRALPTFSALTGDVVDVDGEQWNSTHPFGISWILADLESVLLDGGPPATADDIASRWNDYIG
ncbi:MAG: ABC transporter substrate-binding protein [Actinomycetota bacterium]